MELRCDSRILHGIYDEHDNTVEFTCKSRRCGKEDGIVVLHKFSLSDGSVKTEKFTNPQEEE